ncbi:MAG: C40 family peptidase [Armatimonadetes bacterium]|nr:C40 family peptidase [Armatimonadota bacterium]
MSLRVLTALLSKPLPASNSSRPSSLCSSRRLGGSLVALGAAASLLISLAAVQARPMTRREEHVANRLVRLARHEQHIQARQAAHAAHLATIQARQQVARARLATQNQALTSGNVVMAAYAFRGTRYVMGGTSRSGFDCSGFVRYILGNAGGVSLPRTAADQFWHAQPVAPQDMEPGDLVFFKNTYKRGISHVGIYAGSGRFIHAANPHRGVRMDDLNSAYYQHHFAGARRVLPEQMRALAALPLR